MRTFRTFSLISGTMLAMVAQAQAPQGFSYQAVARDNDGDAVAGQPIGVQFVLHQGTALGAVVYAETHSSSTNTNGLFAVTVGGGSTGTGTFSSIDWSNGPYFLEVGLDVSSSGSFTNVGTQQLMSVPYALYAGKSNLPDGTEMGQIAHWNGNTWVVDSGLYVSVKRFGINNTQPDAPLGIRGEPGQDDKMISFTSNDDSQKWNINLNPTGNDVDGFSIDDMSSGVGSSRVFIATGTGNVGIGTADPDAALTIRADNPLKQHFQNGDVPTQSDFYNLIDSYGMSTGQGNPDSAHIHLTLQSLTGHLGLGTNDPPAPLSIKSRDVLKTYFETGDVPTQQQFYGISTDATGFDIGQGPPDDLTSRFFIQDSTGHIGIGTQDPPAPLSLVSRNVLKSYFQRGDAPAQSDYGITTDSTGFGIEEGMPGSLTSRVFIRSSTGHVGIGTTEPEAPLHLVSREELRIKFENGDIPSENDFSFRTSGDPVNPGFSIEEESSLGHVSRLFIQESSGNVGINELIPDVKLHVSRPLADPSTAIDLLAGTGIMVVGPITDNVVADHRGIQARHGEYAAGSSTLSLTTSELNLQRLGGDIIIHGAAAVAPPNTGIITDDARLGLGTITPTEKIDIDGAIRIGTSMAENDGTIRYTGAGFEGRAQGSWRNLGSEWQKVDNTEGAIHYTPTSAQAQVGIGTSTPAATLHTRYQTQVAADEGAMAVMVENSGTTSSTDGGVARVGLGISCTGVWSSNPAAKNVGLYVSEVTGQSEASSNIAAVLNGNVVIGDLSGGSGGGVGGSRVLSIQNGAAPGPPSSGIPAGGIQVYSADVSGVPTLHVMRGNGEVIKLYRQAALTPAEPTPAGPVYDPTTAALIDNMRTRINELEAKLQAVGLLQ